MKSHWNLSWLSNVLLSTVCWISTSHRGRGSWCNSAVHSQINPSFHRFDHCPSSKAVTIFSTSNSATNWQKEVSLTWQTLLDFHEIFIAWSSPHGLDVDMNLKGVCYHHLDTGSNARILRTAHSFVINSTLFWPAGLHGHGRSCITPWLA